jgi:hypothetical protein
MGMSKYATKADYWEAEADYWKDEAKSNERDAARYRWLRANMMGVIHLIGRPGIGLSGVTGDSLDAQVDAAMAAAPAAGAA